MMAPKTTRYANDQSDLADTAVQFMFVNSPNPIEINNIANPAISICKATESKVDFGIDDDLEMKEPHAQKKHANNKATIAQMLIELSYESFASPVG